MKAVLFCRVSSKEQEESGYSLPAQEKLLREYSLKNSFEVKKESIFAISESASGKKQRQIFKTMLQYVEKTNTKIIVCEKVDRLTRNFKDATDINDWINEDAERQAHFVKENVVLDRDSKSNEKFIWNIKVAVAQYYIDNLSEEVKKGQKEKIAQGWLPTRPPIGYKTVGEKGRKIHVIDDAKAPLVKRMFELYAAGNTSIKKLTEIMNEAGLRNDGGNKLVKSRIHQYLTDPFYMGQNRWNGINHPGKQDTFIDEGIFEKVQRILKSKTTPKYSKHNHLFKGLLRCKECSGIITWEVHKGINYGHCNHYRNCSQEKWTTEHTVEDQLLKGFTNLEIRSPRLAEWLNKALKESHKDEITYHSASVGELHSKHDLIKQRLDKLYDDKLDGKITEEFYQRKFNQYSIELTYTDKSVQRHSNASLRFIELGVNFFEISQRATEIYKKAVLDQKRILIKLVFESITLNNMALEYKYTKPFQMLHDAVALTNSSKMTKEVAKEDRIFEPTKKVDNKLQTDTFEVVRPILLALTNTFRTYDWLKQYQPIDLTFNIVQQILQQGENSYA